MKQISNLKDIKKNSSGEKSLINIDNEYQGKRKKNILGKIKKSYSTLSTDINKDKISNQKVNNEVMNHLKMNLKIKDNIDYGKKIKEAKEFEDLKKIYEKWSGQKYDSSNNKKYSNDEYILDDYIYISNYKLEKQKKKKEENRELMIINMRYKNLLSENKKMKEEINNLKDKINKIMINKSKEKEIQNKVNKLMIDLSNQEELNKKEKNKSLIKAKTRPKINNLKKMNFSLMINKTNPENENENNKINIKDKILDGNKIKEGLKKLNHSFEEKNKNIVFIEENKQEKDINNKSTKNILLDENKIKEEIKKLNDKNTLQDEDEIQNSNILVEKNKIKIVKEENSETNDESVSVKVKNKSKLELNNNINERNRERKKNVEKNNIKITENKENIVKQLRQNSPIKTKIFLKSEKKKVYLKNIIKKANLFSDKNKGKDNLVEILECALDIDKYIENEITINKNDNLITPKEAVYYIENVIIRFLGYFGSELSLKNIKTYIEKEPTNYILRDMTFKLICSGLATHKIYKLIIQNEEKKIQFAENSQEFLDFLENLKMKISNKYNISENYVYFFGNNIQNFEINLLIYNHNIDNVENLLKKYDLRVIPSTLLNNIILSPNIFDINYSKNENDWTKKNLMRGGKKYYPPYGWFGIGLKLKNKYGKDNIWLGKENKEGEWPVAYHGLGKEKPFNRVLDIINGNLKNEVGKLFKNEKNVEKNKNKYPYCGEGVYLSPNINDAAFFSEKTSLGFFNAKFQFAIMARVNPNKIRSPGGIPLHWILNGNNDEMRPYRLLIKITSI